jgi:hypothetical protein
MSFEEETGRGTLAHGCGCTGTSVEISRQIMRLQVVTLIWMVVECALALFSAWRARSRGAWPCAPASKIGAAEVAFEILERPQMQSIFKTSGQG